VQSGDDVFSEETFRYFLAVQRRRSERCGRPFLLLLVEFKDEAGQPRRIEQSLAPLIFSLLRRALRETDVIGWYQKEWAAGALLIELGEGHRPDVPGPVALRVRDALCAALPAAVANRLQVPVYQFRPRLTH
jgi:hypothetical protein